MTRLLAVLLNPPLTSGAASLRHVEAARKALGCSSLIVTNLFDTPTRSVEDINIVGAEEEGWIRAREHIRRSISGSDLLLGAWGISGLTGSAARMRTSQVSWLVQVALGEGLGHVWTVGGTPRHPSRWHQYVSDKYQRASGETMDERLLCVLTKTPLAEFS